MSYILEALKKSERERRLGQVPSLPTLELDAPPKRTRRAIWAAALLLLLTVNAGVLVYLWLQGRHADPSAAALAAKPTPAPQAMQATPPPQIAEKLMELEKRLAELNQPTPAPTAPPQVAATLPPQPVKAARTPPPKARREQAATFDEEPTEAAPRPTPRRRMTEPDDLPAEEQLPKAIRALKINVLAYSDNPAERFAVINMSRRVPGDHLPGGVVLVDILPNGLSLELDGARYRIDH